MQFQKSKIFVGSLIVAYFLPIGSNAFTYPLVHGNIFHLAANMIVLYFFLRSAIDLKTWLVFIVSGYIASVGAYLLYNNHLTVGASGFVYGIMGVYIAFAYRSLWNSKFYGSLFFISVVIALAIGFIIPGLAGLLHLYAIIIGYMSGIIAIRINRCLTRKNKCSCAHQGKNHTSLSKKQWNTTRDMDERTEYTQMCTSVMSAESGTWHQDVSSDEYRLKESDTGENK